MGPTMPTLPALQGFPTHCHALRRIPNPAGPLLVCPHGHNWSPTVVCKFSVLPYRSGSIHALAGSFPIQDITSQTIVRTLLSGWISRFGCPQTITRDQGRQFESQLFHSLARLCGIHLTRTIPNLRPMDSGSGYTALLKPPSCAMLTNSGPRRYR